MPQLTKHGSLIEQYDDVTPAEAREDTLGFVNYNKLREIASRYGLASNSDDTADLRRKLANIGMFVGGVGDDNVYRLTEDGEEHVARVE